MEFKENEQFIWLEDENGKRIAYVEFAPVGEDTLELAHTVVSEEMRGQGVAGKLLLHFAQMLEREGKNVIPSCPYAAGWFAKNEVYRKLVK